MQLFQTFLPSVKQMDDGVLKEAVLLPALALTPPAVNSHKLHLRLWWKGDRMKQYLSPNPFLTQATPMIFIHPWHSSLLKNSNMFSGQREYRYSEFWVWFKVSSQSDMPKKLEQVVNPQLLTLYVAEQWLYSTLFTLSLMKGIMHLLWPGNTTRSPEGAGECCRERGEAGFSSW